MSSGKWAGPHPKKKPQMSPYQRRIMATIKANKAEVFRGRSAFSDLDWSGIRCLRCHHYCADRHRPGNAGPCKTEGCYCQLAQVMCACKHSSADHEPFGTETRTNCGLCSCIAFGAMFTQFSIPEKGNP
jgi:hypothetical protein